MVKLLFFGATADIARARKITTEIQPGSTTNSVLEAMLEKFPGLRAHKLHVAVNQQYSTGSDPVVDGDEIAIFTAVSGG